MNEAVLELSEFDRARVRIAIATIDRHLTCLSREATAQDHQDATRDLALSWAGLVELLALAPAPEVRQCPCCEQIVRRAATRCGYCWIRLSPGPPTVSKEVQ